MCNTVKCKICGKEENLHWIDQMNEELKRESLCFTCNHWRNQHQLDLEVRGEYGYAIVNGTHYVLGKHKPHTWPTGMGGSLYKIIFNDGTVKFNDNLWCQGVIPEGHWREVMPDNARFETPTPEERKTYFEQFNG